MTLCCFGSIAFGFPVFSRPVDSLFRWIISIFYFSPFFPFVGLLVFLQLIEDCQEYKPFRPRSSPLGCPSEKSPF